MLLIRTIIIAAAALLLCAVANPAAAQMIGGDVGIIEVTSDPSGASVNYGGQYEGTTPLDIRVYATGTPGQQLVISKSGYKTYSTTAPHPGAGETKYVHAVLEPIAPTPTPVYDGYFSITSTPSGATVRIDGHYVGTTPISNHRVSGGTTHRIQVEYSGYESWSERITAYAGETTPVHAALTRRPEQTGSLAIKSSPSGADVYVDGSYRGYTPMTVGNLHPGAHTLELRLAGYDKFSQTIQIYAGQTTSKNVGLQHKSPKTGSIAVKSFPSGAAIYLDGSYEGNTYTNDYFDIIGIPAGSHSLMLRKPGYADYSTYVSVTGGGVKYISATLSQHPEPATNGRVNVMSQPSGAEVYIDNLFRGYSPVVVPDIAPGSHPITLKVPGYSEWMSTVQVNAGETAQVSATLTPKPAPPQPTPSGSLPVAALGAVAMLGILFVVAKRK